MSQGNVMLQGDVWELPDGSVAKYVPQDVIRFIYDDIMLLNKDVSMVSDVLTNSQNPTHKQFENFNHYVLSTFITAFVFLDSGVYVFPSDLSCCYDLASIV